MLRSSAALALIAATVCAATAQPMYRCSDGGKTTYSDRPCVSGNEVKRIAADGGPTPDDVARARMRAQNDRNRHAANAAATPTLEEASTRAGAPSMSARDIDQRKRELKVLLASTTIERERRRAAQDELNRLERGVAQQVSAEDQARLRVLRVELASTDQRTRDHAEAEQRAILDRYDSPSIVANRKRTEAADRMRTEAADRMRAEAAAARRSPAGVPSTIASCDPGGCFDTNGERYIGAGTTLVDTNGKVCQRIGIELLCN